MRWIIAELVWVGLTALIIMIDSRSIEARAKPGTQDITDRSVGSYVPFMAVFGAFVIPFYLWNSRQTGIAVFAGLSLMIACAAVVGAVVSL